VALTEQAIVAVDAKTGQQKWTRQGLDAQEVTAGPDGSVYVLIQLAKQQLDQGEARKYRIADVSIASVGAAPPEYVALLRLDPHSGKTLWGTRNIGRHVLFEGDRLFVVDRVDQLNLLASNIMVGNHSVRCLSPCTGKDVWSYVKTGDLYHDEVSQGKVFLVTATDRPSGFEHPTLAYDLQLIEAK